MNKNKNAKTASKTTIRCAIYTRKSCEEGLELEFNSLHAQRESAEAFIKSQHHEGWVCNPELYDDGGFSGGSLERPALNRLLADIQAGKVDCVVVYKVDRLTTSDESLALPTRNSCVSKTTAGMPREMAT